MLSALPNLLTVLRFPLAGFLWVAPHCIPCVLSLAALAAASDVLDGWAARRLRAHAQRRGVSAEAIERSKRLGAWLDPVCDKIFMASLLAVAWYSSRAALGWVLLVASRDLVQAILVAIYHATPGLRSKVTIDFTAGPLGKATTTAQFVAATALLLHAPLSVWLCGLAGGLGLLAVAHYVWRSTKPHLRRSSSSS